MSDLSELLDLIKRHREMGVLAALPLTHDSTVIVAGSYKGDTIDFLYNLYECNIYGFEPQEWACTYSRARFDGLSKIKIFPYALGVQTGTFPMYEWGTDACSFIEPPDGRKKGIGRMRDVVTVFDKLNIGQVHASLFNLEGYEHLLLPYMEHNVLLHRINDIILQIHRKDAQPYIQLLGALMHGHVRRWEQQNWQWWSKP